MARGVPPAASLPQLDAGNDGSAITGADPRGARVVVQPAQATWLAATGATLVYATVAVFAYRHVLFASTSSLPGCNCGDQAQEVWFLRWPLYAVTHGQNPFFSTWMNYPKGVNLAINTTAPLLGLVTAPLQLTIGTVATFTALLVLSFTASALSMCLAIRHWVRSWPAAFAGGLLYGFSPYMIGQGLGHVFLVAVFIPPIVLVLLDEIVVTQRRSARRDGLLLGALLVAQYLISPEILAMTVVMAVLGIALLALARRRTVHAHAPHVLRTVGYSAALCVAALAYPLWMSLRGPQHVHGPPHPLRGLALFPGDLLGPVLPTSNQLLAPMVAKFHGDVLVGQNPGENGMYLGLPLIAVLAVLARRYRRDRTLVFFSAMAVVAAILALGGHLVVAGRDTGVPLPFDALGGIPLLQDILAVRFSLFMQMFAAAALAVGLDRLITSARGSRWRLLATSFHAPGLVVPAAVALAALLPLVPDLPYPSTATSTPSFFTSAAVDRIPPGSAVLTYPYPLVPDAEWNMTFQVDAGMRFKLIGGDAFVPGPHGTSISKPTSLRPTVVERMFTDAYTSLFARGALGANSARTPPIDRATVAALETFLHRYHVSTVVADDLGTSPQTVVRYVSAALGPPELTGGVWAWFDVPRLLGRLPGAAQR